MVSLKDQTQWCKRTQWILGLAGLLAVAAFYLASYRPTTRQLAELHERVAQRRAELDEAQQHAGRLPEEMARVQDLQKRLEKFGKKLPHQRDLGEFIGQITQLSKHSSLKNLTVQPGLSHANDLFSEIPIVMSFQGDFTNVFQFLREAEDMQRLTRVRDLSIKTKVDGSGQVDVQMSMNIYFSEG